MQRKSDTTLSVVPVPVAVDPIEPSEADARLELTVGTLIQREVAAHRAVHPHGVSSVADDLYDWAIALQRDGRRRLSILGARPLAIAEEGH